VRTLRLRLALAAQLQTRCTDSTGVTSMSSRNVLILGSRVLPIAWFVGVLSCTPAAGPSRPAIVASIVRGAKHQLDAQDQRPSRTVCWQRFAAEVYGVKSLWAARVNDVWAVGFHTVGGAIHRWDGHNWRTVYQSDDVAFSDVWGSAADDVWIAGGSENVVHWDGVRFSKTKIGYDSGGQLWGSGRDDVWMTGPANNLLHFQGVRWEQVPFADPPADPKAQFNINALWGTGARDVWAAGRSGVLLHFDGITWRRVKSSTTEDLFALWGFTTNDIWAAGDNGTVIHWDGTRWATISFPPVWRVVQLWGASAHAVWAATERQTFRWDGHEWSAVEGVKASSVGGGNAGDVWAAQEHGLLHLGLGCEDVTDAKSPERLPYVLAPTSPERRLPDTSVDVPPTETEARAFAHDLLEIAKANDVERWTAMLSWKQRARCEPALHLFAWRNGLIAEEKKLENAQYSTGRLGRSATIRFAIDGKTALILLVTREDGALRLDEN
jgi:hypothetical protein